MFKSLIASHVIQEIFARRLEQFYESTSPLLDFYAAQQSDARSATQLVTLRGNTSDEIWPQLEDLVKLSLRPKPLSPNNISELAATSAAAKRPSSAGQRN